MRANLHGSVRSWIDYAPVGKSRKAKRRVARRWSGLALEALECRVLMHANAVEDAEHVAVFGTYVTVQATGQKVEIGGLLPDSSITIESINPAPASLGAAPPVLNWSDPNSWETVSNGVPQMANGSPVHAVPQTGDNVLITGGTTVMVDGDESSASIHGIRVDGTLTFSTAPTGGVDKLLVNTIIVEPQGTWQEGTAANPIPANVTAEVSFADNGDINTTWDPGQFSLGMLTHGAVSIYGTEVASFDAALPTSTDGTTKIGPTPSQTPTKSTPSPAPQTITLDLTTFPGPAPGSGSVTATVPLGWQVGDRLIITGDTAPNAAGVNQDEQVSIAAINGNVITLAQPLKYAHTAPAGQSIYVSDVSRNVVFDSQSISLGDYAVAHRGHMMFMHSANVHIDAAGFYGLGRTDKRNPIDDPNPVEDVLAEQGLAANPSAPLPADDYYVIAQDPATSKYLADANGNPIYATATGPNGQPLLDINNNPVRKVMTTDVIDSKTGKRVMVPVMDVNGKPIPLYLAADGTTQVPIPQGQTVPTGDTPLYQLAADGTTLKDSSGNPVPQYELQLARSGLNPRGRYAVHFHRTGTDPGSLVASVNDSAVVDSPGWGIVNHSSDVNVSNNVVFNAVGAAYVTEAGDELGSFNHNIAIHSQGAGGGIEDRKNIGDFGQLGDGFWFQGGNVSVTNNISTGQRHSGFVFFPVGLNQKGLGVTQIAFDNLSPQVQNAMLDVSASLQKAVAAEHAAQAALPPGQLLPDDQLVYVPDGNVPLRQFSGNTAYADGDGLETWFSLLNFSTANLATIAQDPAASLQTVISNFSVWNVGSGTGIFDPYTNSLAFQNVNVTGALNNTGSWTTGFGRNNVTENLTYTDVNVQGFGIGINVPVNGVNNIFGGTFNNLKSIYISTANDPGRVVNINDNGPNDPIAFPDNLTTSTWTTTTTTTTNAQGKTVTTKTSGYVYSNPQQYDIYLQSNFNPMLQDITTLFNPDVIRLGTVMVKGQQVYYNEQAANFVPFTTALAAQEPFIPAALVGLTNQQMFTQYGLAIGGVLAPPDATASNPKVFGLIGSTLASYLPNIQLLSAKYTQFDALNPSYTLSYRYNNPGAPGADPKTGNVTVKETTKRQLQPGWNLLQITNPFSGPGQPQNRTLLVYGDIIPPTFMISANDPLVVNRADVNNGSTYYVTGRIIDDSFGSKDFQIGIALNDPKHVLPVYLADGKTVDPNHIDLTFTIQDNAHNTYQVTIELTVSDTAVLLKDIGRKDLPFITPSSTLLSLVLLLDGSGKPVTGT
jgi:hypothetical protein